MIIFKIKYNINEDNIIKKHLQLIILIFSHFFAFFLVWRNLWTLLSCMRSSRFPNTTTIPNFRSISPTVIEFWKRYHQTAKIRVLRPSLKVASYWIVFISTMILVGLGGPPFTICTKYGFLVLFRRFWPAQSSPATEILLAALIGPGDY